ncbi:hypothetical protein PPACK8108_LOCUS3394 [Phakopsora pachyrhizi]|uniref:Uncharacterized protein n=1 Tax=Phakopsora pachyrhizi TaxID=170000 RepID=A0AAV0AKF9_PHAPC|nr:hypothetical protein PPACK8108_LOCUS3394 [Phakopsora pachyrhizi]
MNLRPLGQEVIHISKSLNSILGEEKDDDKGLSVKTIKAREVGLNRSLIDIKEFEMIKGKTMMMIRMGFRPDQTLRSINQQNNQQSEHNQTTNSLPIKLNIKSDRSGIGDRYNEVKSKRLISKAISTCLELDKQRLKTSNQTRKHDEEEEEEEEKLVKWG